MLWQILRILQCHLNLIVASASPSLARDAGKTVYILNLNEFTKIMSSYGAFLEATIKVSPQGTPFRF